MPTLFSICAQQRRRGGAFDADAADYFARIVTAGSTISEANKTAVNAFVVGCKDDGIWSAIKASCILAGADTLAGALVPLVGPAPTNVGPFVAGDYSRTTGLLGDGSTKYLNANITAADMGQNNVSLSNYFVEVIDTGVVDGLAGNFSGGTSNDWLFLQKQNNLNPLGAANSGFLNYGGTLVPGIFGVSRAASGTYTRRVAGATASVSAASAAPSANPILIFDRGSASIPSAQRCSFYSIGESLDLAQLEARLTTLMGAIT